MKANIKQKLKERWQKQWEERTGRWFYKIQRDVGKMRYIVRNRREESIISRMKSGHTRLNNTLSIIGKHPTANCEFCETLEHVMNYRPKYEDERKELTAN